MVKMTRTSGLAYAPIHGLCQRVRQQLAMRKFFFVSSYNCLSIRALQKCQRVSFRSIFRVVTEMLRPAHCTPGHEASRKGDRGGKALAVVWSIQRIIRLTPPDRRARARVMCDYIAGITDGFAIRTYKRRERVKMHT